MFRSATSFLPAGTSPQSLPQPKKGKGKTKALLNDAVGVDTLLSYLSGVAKEGPDGEPLKVAVVGLANVCVAIYVSLQLLTCF